MGGRRRRDEELSVRLCRSLEAGDRLVMNMTGGVELHGDRRAACLRPPEPAEAVGGEHIR